MNVQYLYTFGHVRSLLIGAGLAYAVEKESFTHVPIVILFPTVYTGYHAYTNKESISQWIRKHLEV